MKDNGVDFNYEGLEYTYILKHKYTPDFWIKANGKIIETKGRFTSKDRTKTLVLLETYPHLRDTFYMLFQRDNTLSKKSKTKYTDWCTKHGITCAVGNKVPKHWIGGMTC